MDYDQGKNLMSADLDPTASSLDALSMNPNNQQDLQSALLEMKIKYE